MRSSYVRNAFRPPFCADRPARFSREYSAPERPILGAGLFKKRLARPRGGKSGGFRVIVAYRPPRADRVLIAYAFAKSAVSTLTPQGHEALSKVAQAFIAANDERVAELVASRDVSEVTCDADDEG